MKPLTSAIGSEAGTKAARFYSTLSLNRDAHRRLDSDWLDEVLAHPQLRVFASWRSRSLFDPETGQPVYLPLAFVKKRIAQNDPYLILGADAEGAVMGLDFSKLKLDPEQPATIAEAIPGVSTPVVLEDVRPFALNLDPDLAAQLGYVRSMFSWHRATRFCGSCGALADLADHGHSRRCTNNACRMQHFPRINPAVIMLVCCGEHALIARNARFPRPLYSALAGYVEHGESLEQAVVREVWEEVGVKVDRVSYLASQPWPYTQSLMLAFRAWVDDSDTLPAFTLEEDEIAHAVWITREEVRASEGNPDFMLPGPDAAARALLEDWLSEG